MPASSEKNACSASVAPIANMIDAPPRATVTRLTFSVAIRTLGGGEHGHRDPGQGAHAALLRFWSAVIATPTRLPCTPEINLSAWTIDIGTVLCGAQLWDCHGRTTTTGP